MKIFLPENSDKTSILLLTDSGFALYVSSINVELFLHEIILCLEIELDIFLKDLSIIELLSPSSFKHEWHTRIFCTLCLPINDEEIGITTDFLFPTGFSMISKVIILQSLLNFSLVAIYLLGTGRTFIPFAIFFHLSRYLKSFGTIRVPPLRMFFISSDLTLKTPSKFKSFSK